MVSCGVYIVREISCVFVFAFACVCGGDVVDATRRKVKARMFLRARMCACGRSVVGALGEREEWIEGVEGIMMGMGDILRVAY
jgi:hypothetical protein